MIYIIYATSHVNNQVWYSMHIIIFIMLISIIYSKQRL